MFHAVLLRLQREEEQAVHRPLDPKLGSKPRRGDAKTTWEGNLLGGRDNGRISGKKNDVRKKVDERKARSCCWVSICNELAIHLSRKICFRLDIH